MNIPVSKYLLSSVVALAFMSVPGCKKSDKKTPTPPAVTTQTTTQPPDFSYSGYTVVGKEVSFTCKTPSKSEWWDFGDGTTFDRIGGPAQHVVGHTYRQTGSYTVTLKINGDTNLVVKKTLIVTPDFSFYWTGVPVVGDTIYFHFHEFLPRDSVYSWTFGDGTTSADSTPWHIYTGAGTFPVNFYVNGKHKESLWSGITIYNDPIYTWHIAGSRIWKGKVFIKALDGVDPGSYHMQGDTVFAIGYINKVTLSFNYAKHIFDPALSNSQELYFTNSGGNYVVASKIYYNQPKDSISIYATYTQGPNYSAHTPAILYEWYFNTP
jgi:hypothetical protein